MITTFVDKKKKLEDGGMVASDLPVVDKRETAREGHHVDETPTAEKYRADFHAKVMRIKVLENEQLDAKATHKACTQKIESAQKVCSHLEASAAEVRAKIEQLQQELQLVEEHKAIQQKKIEEALQEKTAAASQVDLIDRTMAPLAQECEKIKLLYEHLVGQE